MSKKKEEYQVPIIEFVEFELSESIAASGVAFHDDIFRGVWNDEEDNI